MVPTTLLPSVRTNPRRVALATALALLLVVAAAIGSCGTDPGAGARIPEVWLTVSVDHGRQLVLDTQDPKPGDGTALGLLEANAQVSHADGSYFVSSVDGLAEGDDARGRPQVWTLIVNGTVYSEDRATPQLHRGDRVWWDRRESTSSATAANPGAVGGFPAPLAGMAEGQRPVWLRCADPLGYACRRVKAALKVYRARLAGPVDIARDPRDALAPVQVIVAPVARLRSFDSPTRGFLASVDQPSLLFVRPSRSGAFHTLDVGGTRLGTAVRAGGGFVHAYASAITRPIWIVAGVDDLGLRRAARAFNTADLHARTAVWVDARGVHPLPESRAKLDAAAAAAAAANPL